MDNVVYFKICNNENEYKNMQPYKITKYELINRIIKIIYNLRFEIVTQYSIIEKIKNTEKNIYMIYDSKKDERKILYKINRRIEKMFCENPNTKIILSKQIKELIKKNKDMKNIGKLNFIVQNSKENKAMYIDLVNEVVMSVIRLRNEIPEEESMYILLNSNNIRYINWINTIILNYKMINIVTQYPTQFKIFENNAEDKMEPISVLNNKRKSIAKAKYIVNIDFRNEEIINYNINRTAIIFNISNEKIKNLNNFDGNIINNIEIEKKNTEFDFRDEYIENKIDKDEVLRDIENYRYVLEGNNGKIEFDGLV